MPKPAPKPTTMDLIQMAVQEWLRGEMSTDAAMWAITIVSNVVEPDADCIEWGRAVANKL